MKNKFSAFTLTLVILLSFIFVASAEDKNYVFTNNAMDAGSLSVLNATAAEIEKNYSVEPFVVIDETVSGTEETIDLAEETVEQNATTNSSVCLTVTEDHYYFNLSGKAEYCIEKETKNKIWESVSSYKNDRDIAAAFFSEIAAVFEEYDNKEKDYCVDMDNLLTDNQEQTLETMLKQKSDELNFDIVIVVPQSLDMKSPEEFSDDYFDYKGFGRGENYDGCLLMVCMEERDWYISTSGRGIYAMPDVYEIFDEFSADLSDEYFYDAFKTYVRAVAESVENYDTEEAEHLSKFDKDYCVDKAGVLTENEISDLEGFLKGASMYYNVDIAAVVVNDLAGVEAHHQYAMTYMEEMNYGQGSTNEACLLIVNPSEIYWGIESSGDYMNSVIDDEFIEMLKNDSEGLSTAELIKTFNENVQYGIDNSDLNINEYFDSDPWFSVGGHTVSHFEVGDIVFGIAIGLVIALIIMSILKGQLKTVRRSASASDYIVPGSFVLTESEDRFRFSNVSRTAKNTESSSGGGSNHSGGGGVHISSSGHTHGGGGGKF